MSAILKLTEVLVILSLALTCSEAQQGRPSNITRGSSLTPTKTSSWPSSSGQFAFGFYRDGNGFSVGIFLAGIPEKTVVWTFNRDNPPVSSKATFRFTPEGRLGLESSRGEELSGEQTPAAFSASMLDSGNFVMYNSDGDLVWQSFEHPTDTLLPGQRLEPGKQLVSSASLKNHASGIFRMKMQEDGFLVQYPINTPDTAPHAYWAAVGPVGGKNVTMVFDEEGRLFLMNSLGAVIQNVEYRGVSVTPFPKYDNATTVRYSGAEILVRLDWDGILRLNSYKKKLWSVEWTSTDDKCRPKGLCGLNGFCVMNDQEADCRCISGFDFVQKGNWSAGCGKNYVAYSCGKESASMDELSNTVWENNTYSPITVADKDGCIKACLEDCNCEAAFYEDKSCQKQRLPLRYGRRLPSESITTLIKVFDHTPESSRKIGNSPTKIKKEFLIVGVSLVSLGFVMLVASTMVILCRKRICGLKRLDHSCNDAEVLGEEVAIKSFTFKELERMTGGFQNEIGRGSFGTVYRGEIHNGVGEREVAVKMLQKMLAEGENEFRNEMRAIGRTHHKNLVRLIGYCQEGSNRLLVYEYMKKGSLAEMLFSGPENRSNWEERVGIACGVGRGLVYLHEECESQIIHCDIKPQNILMDEHGCPKISDFGLAKFLKSDQTKTFTGIRGTRGYVAPEWHRKQAITTKADVYSFGIVLLEIICCRKNTDFELSDEEAVLEDWAYECFENDQVMRLVGSEEGVQKRQLERMIKVALWCLQDESSLRPSMKKVVLMLEGTVDIPVPPCPQFFS